MSTPLSDTDDSALLARVRRGDTDAMAELWIRHYPAALAAARRVSRQPKDAEEVASDAFAAMLQALHNDAGPSTAVRAYLMTAVRNQAANRARRASASDIITDEIADFEDADRAAADPVAHHAELGLVRAAFASLPRRWQTVLWRTAVDHDSNTAIAADLGMSPNALAALARRARLGFRTAYLQAHVSTHPVAPECAPYAGRLAELVSATGRKLAAAQDTRHHVSECDSCTRRFADLEAVDRGLGALLLPALLALGPGIKWVTAATAGTATATAVTAGHATHATGLPWLKGLVRPGRSRQLAVGGAAVAAAVVGIGSAYALAHGGSGPTHTKVAVSAGSAAANRASQSAAQHGNKPASVARAKSPTHAPAQARTTVKIAPRSPATSSAPVVTTRSSSKSSPAPSRRSSPSSTSSTTSPTPTSTTSSATPPPSRTVTSTVSPPPKPRPTRTPPPTGPPPWCPPWACWIWEVVGQ